MRNAVLCTVTVLLLASAAGCNTLFPDGESIEDRGRLDVPTRTTTDPGGDGLPPGLSQRGVSDPFRLADTHRESLDGRTFWFQHDRAIVAPNGTVLRQERASGRVSPNRTRYGVVKGLWRIDHVWIHDRFWSANESDPVLRASEREESTEYVSYSNPPEGPLTVRDVLDRDPAFRNRMSQILTTVDRAQISETNGSKYVVRVNDTTNENAIWSSSEGKVSSVRLFFIVDSSGLIELLYLEYNATADGQPIQVKETFKFGPVDGGTIAPPGWTETARSSANRTVPGDRSRDSVDKPRISGEGTHWDNRTDDEEVSDPWPPRSVRALVGEMPHPADGRSDRSLPVLATPQEHSTPPL